MFRIAKMCKQYKYPSTKGINKMWYIHTMECHSAKENEVLISATMWMNLENIMKETSQLLCDSI